jgi:hypothetical protein
MRIAAAFGLAFCTSLCSAQTTWKGLHFGEQRQDVRTDLHAQGLDVELSQENSLQSTADYELALPGLLHTLPMRANFHFDDHDQLADINLVLDVAGMRRYWAVLGPDEALMNFAEEKLLEALSGRYGAPLYRSPDCEKAAAACMVYWRGQDQVVEMERGPGAHGSRLMVRYQPLATEL